MDIQNFKLPILAHAYVPRYHKVGPGPGPVFNPGVADQLNQAQFQARG